ncbi:MAG TPA: head GIN domain-containing protein [Bacteroidia bacterium]
MRIPASARTFFFLSFPKLIGMLLILISLFISCSKENRWDCIKRTGEKSSQQRILPPFNKIFMKDNIDVYITQGPVQDVRVEAGKNLVSLIKTEVSDGMLTLKNDNKCNWMRNYKNGTISVYITMPQIRYVYNYGSGEIKGTNSLSCDTLDILTNESGDVEFSLTARVVFLHLNSTSDVTLHGTAPILGISHEGEGYLYCNDLLTNITWSHSHASGNEYLNVQNGLYVTIDWAGNIYYTGNPTTELKGNGIGQLIKEN